MPLVLRQKQYLGKQNDLAWKVIYQHTCHTQTYKNTKAKKSLFLSR